MIETISHITLIVKDPFRTGRLLQEVLGAQEVYDSRGKNFSLSYEKFYVIGGIWFAVMEGEPPERSYGHIAFKVPESELDEYAVRIGQLGLETRIGRDRVEGEGRSLYFYDYDNHLFELHTGTLEERLRRYAHGQPISA